MNRIMMIAIVISVLAGTQSVMAMEIPDANSADARVYAARCSVCHSLPHPKRLSWPAWQHMLHVMSTRMRERGVPQPGKGEWQQIAAYLKRYAR